jgi:hypothetical protein
LAGGEMDNARKKTRLARAILWAALAVSLVFCALEAHKAFVGPRQVEEQTRPIDVKAYKPQPDRPLAALDSIEQLIDSPVRPSTEELEPAPPPGARQVYVRTVRDEALVGKYRYAGAISDAIAHYESGFEALNCRKIAQDAAGEMHRLIYAGNQGNMILVIKPADNGGELDITLTVLKATR